MASLQSNRFKSLALATFFFFFPLFPLLVCVRAAMMSSQGAQDSRIPVYLMRMEKSSSMLLLTRCVHKVRVGTAHPQ